MSAPTPSSAKAADAALHKRIDDRLTALEIKASFAEDLVDSLNQVLVRQQQDIDQLMHQVSQLRGQLALAGADAGAPRQPRDELPPHY